MHNQAQFKTVVKTNMLVDFNARGQKEMDFFIEESVILDYGPMIHFKQELSSACAVSYHAFGNKTSPNIFPNL